MERISRSDKLLNYDEAINAINDQVKTFKSKGYILNNVSITPYMYGNNLPANYKYEITFVREWSK